MEVSLAVLADYANVSQEGKLNLLGLFDVVYVRSFPGALAQCFLVVRVVAEVHERGTRHRVRFRLTDPDSRQLSELSAELGVPDDAAPGAVAMNLILPASPMLIFQRPGPHELKVFLDDVEKDVIKVSAVDANAPAG